MRVPQSPQGVHRVELRTLPGRTLELPASASAQVCSATYRAEGQL